MKKVLKNISCFVMVMALCFGFVSIISAKSVEATMNYNQNVMFIKSNTSANLETVVKAYNMSGPILVENTIQRIVDITGVYKNVGQRKFEVTATNVQFKQIYTDVKNGTADTRTIWVNQTPGSTMNGKFYINNYVG